MTAPIHELLFLYLECKLQTQKICFQLDLLFAPNSLGSGSCVTLNKPPGSLNRAWKYLDTLNMCRHEMRRHVPRS